MVCFCPKIQENCSMFSLPMLSFPSSGCAIPSAAGERAQRPVCDGSGWRKGRRRGGEVLAVVECVLQCRQLAPKIVLLAIGAKVRFNTLSRPTELPFFGSGMFVMFRRPSEVTFPNIWCSWGLVCVLEVWEMIHDSKIVSTKGLIRFHNTESFF